MKKDIPTIDYGLHDLSKLNFSLVKKSLKKKYVTNDSYCRELEKKISRLTGSNYCVVCNSGTSALFMSILAIKEKKPIIMLPNINFISVANISFLLKGKLILCDVNEKTGMIDENTFKEALNKCKVKKIKPDIFIPVHYAGNVLNLKKIHKICKKEKIKIIEDGCHSFGSSNSDFKVGSSKYSELTTFSFHPLKNITTIEGGAVTTNSIKMYKKLIELRSFSLIKTKIDDPYKLKYPSLNFRMGEINAVIGIDQIKKVDKIKQIRQQLVNYYIKKFEPIKKYVKIENESNEAIFWHLLVVHVEKKYLKLKKKLMEYLKSKKIATQIHYKPLNNHKILNQTILFSISKKSEIFYKTQLTLPLHTKMRNEDIDYVFNNIKKFFLNYN